jgi:glycosyltransferase involved in cell wall biosynthesis
MRSNSLKVLTIAHNAVAQSNRRRVDALSRAGVNVTLLTPPWWFEEGRKIVVPHLAPWRVGRTLFIGNGTRHLYVTGLLQAIRASKPDVIDLFEEPFSLVALETLLLRDLFAPSAAVVFYSAVNVQREWHWPYRAIERFTLRRADGAHAPNHDVPGILRMKGFLNKPVSVIPLGVDAERFSDAKPMEFPNMPGPRIGFVGRLEPVKGIDVLLDAFARLSFSASLIIAGDGSERSRLPRRADVHLIPPVSYEDMPAFLKSLDVLVLPSVTILPLHREQFGRVLIDAMAAGVPVVGSNSGAIPEVIAEAGLVVPERDPSALAQSIERVLSDGALRDRLVERGRQAAANRFSWTTIAEQTLELFRSALAHRRGAIAHLQEVRA